MQSVRNLILRHIRLRGFLEQRSFNEKGNIFKQLVQRMCVSTSAYHDEIMDRVVKLVKNYDKIDSSKVSETADFQKDLFLDSLDRVELVMAIEEEFNIEIPDEETDKLTCCADIAKFISSGAGPKISK